MSDIDRLAMAPFDHLAEYGVTADNADLLRPTGEVAERLRLRARQASGERLLVAVGASSREDLLEALRGALEVLEGDDGGAR